MSGVLDAVKFGTQSLVSRSRARADTAVFDRSGLVADTAAPLPDDVLRMLCGRFDVRPISNR